MGALLDGLADRWPKDSAIGHFFATFDGDIGPGGHSLPLRLAGGLHALVLTGRDPDLAAVYPPEPPDAARLIPAALTAIETHSDFLLDWCQSPPQTNEVRRSVAIIPAAHVAADLYPLPLITSELGASGGLNLMWDRFAVQTSDTTLGPDDPALTLTPDWTGPTPPTDRPTVADRHGVDLNPLNAHDPADALRLRAYLWPDQPNRMAPIEAAIAAQKARVDKGDAIDWLAQRLATPMPGHLHLIYHTVAWQYFPAEVQAKGTALIEAAGASATDTAPIAWFAMEHDGDNKGVGLTLRLWPGNQCYNLGRADFHGRWITWLPSLA